RRDSAPRGGERGPDASPGHRRARTGEGAGEAAAGRVDVVIAPLREISTQQLLSRPEDGSSSESHIDLWTYLSSRRRMGLDTHQSFEVKAAPSRPGPSSVVGWQWHTRSLVFGRLPTYRRFASIARGTIKLRFVGSSCDVARGIRLAASTHTESRSVCSLWCVLSRAPPLARSRFLA